MLTHPTETAARVKRELHDIAALQDRVASVKKAIQRAEQNVRLGSNKANRELRMKLRALRDTERHLSTQIEALYAELSVPADFPGIKRYGIAFVKRLIVLHDTRRNVQQRVAGRLFEYERIDQATGGSGRRLGLPSSHYSMYDLLTPPAQALRSTRVY